MSSHLTRGQHGDSGVGLAQWVGSHTTPLRGDGLFKAHSTGETLKDWVPPFTMRSAYEVRDLSKALSQRTPGFRSQGVDAGVTPLIIAKSPLRGLCFHHCPLDSTGMDVPVRKGAHSCKQQSKVPKICKVQFWMVLWTHSASDESEEESPYFQRKLSDQQEDCGLHLQGDRKNHVWRPLVHLGSLHV